MLSWSSVAQARSRTRKIHEPQLSTFTKPDFPLEDPPISHSFLTKCLAYATEIELRRHAATAGQGVAHVLSWSSVFCRPLRRALNRESQAQQDVKSTEWYALRRHNLRIHTWHTAAPPYCTCSKLEFAPSASQRMDTSHMQTGFGTLVPARPSRTAGLPQGKAATPELQLRKHAAASAWGSCGSYQA